MDRFRPDPATEAPAAGLRGLVVRLGCTPAELGALGLLVAGSLAALGMLWLLVARPGAASAVREAGGEPLAVEAEPVVVHVAGRVATPGVYRLPGGSRVADAVDRAGGPLSDALLDGVNLARPVTDGEQLVVPGPAPPAAPPAPGMGRGDVPAGAAPPAAPTSPASARRPDGTLDLNRASLDELDELPGIGPVLAERIVEHREAGGGFRTVADLRDVPGIGEKTFQELAGLVSV
jgi:competence protein ComEA